MEKTTQFFCLRKLIYIICSILIYAIKYFWYTDKCLLEIDMMDGIGYNRNNY